MVRHYPLSPSASTIWLECPGSIDQRKHDHESPYAKEGEEAHDLAASILLGYEPERSINGVEDLNRTEMIDAVRVYTDFVDGVKTVAGEHLLVSAIEQTLESQKIPGLGGTIDCLVIYRENGKTILHVIDYKHGKGVAVSAINNTQLLCYLLLAREFFTRYEPTDFRATIVQPRHEGVEDVQTASYTHLDLEEFRDRVWAMMFSTELKPGHHCRWCDAQTYCPEVYSLALEAEAIDLDNEPVEDWVRLHEASGAIKATLSAIAGRLKEALIAGKHVDGVKLVEMIGNRTWIEEDEDKLLEALKAKGVGPILATVKKVSIKSPRQIEQVIKERDRLKGTSIDDLIYKPKRGLTVVPESDKRPGVDVEAVDPFSDDGDSEL